MEGVKNKRQKERIIVGVMELRVIVLVTLICLGTVIGQFEEEEDTYRGLFIGSLNSYHHQVNSGFPISNMITFTFKMSS